jgi:hypothetical protein
MHGRQVQQFEGKTCTPMASIAEGTPAAITVHVNVANVRKNIFVVR